MYSYRDALSKTQAEIKKYNSALDDMQSETTSVVSASQKLKNEISSQQDKLDDLKSKYSNVVLEQGKYSKYPANGNAALFTSSDST